MTEPFDQVKQQILTNLTQGLDFSPKGSIDIPVRDLVSLLNALPDYVTTSSCSGRVSVSFPLHENKGVHWTFVKHGFVTREEIERAIIISHTHTDTETHAHKQAKDALYTLKCEPLILHLCCRDVEAARAMHQLAAECGYRESGVTLGQRRAMLAIRTTAFHLELPLARNGAFLFARDSERDGESERDFLQILVDEANDRLRQNFARADRLLSAIKQRFAFPYFSICALSDSFPSLSAGPESDAHTQQTQRNALFRQEPHLWLRAGHTTFSHNVEGSDMVVLGGQGVESALSSPPHNHTQRCGRNVTHFSLSEYCSAHKGLSSSAKNALAQNRARSLYRDLPQCVHARVIPLTVRTQHGEQPRHVLVVSGGRASPAAPPLPCVCVYVLCEREGEKKYVLVPPERVRCEGAMSPCARWAHTAERLAENSFFLCGGRDGERVFDDVFIATLNWHTETERVSEEELQLVVRWEQPEWLCVPPSQPSHTDSFSARDVFARYAHACVSLWAAEESVYGLESGGRQLLIHGGARSLSDPAAVCEDAFVLNPHTRTMQRVVFTAHASTDEESHSKDVPPRVLNNTQLARVGHTITALPGKCLLVIGGASAYSECDTGSTAHTMLWEYTATSPWVASVSISVRPIELHTCSPSQSTLAHLPCEQCRAHHSAHYDAAAQTLCVIGGGAASLAFGEHFCASWIARVQGLSASHTTHVLAHTTERGAQPSYLAQYDQSTPSAANAAKPHNTHTQRAHKSAQRENEGTQWAILARPSAVKALKTLLERRSLLDKREKIFRTALSLSLDCEGASRDSEGDSSLCISLGDTTQKDSETQAKTINETHAQAAEGVTWMAVPITSQCFALLSPHAQSEFVAELREVLGSVCVALRTVESLKNALTSTSHTSREKTVANKSVDSSPNTRSDQAQDKPSETIHNEISSAENAATRQIERRRRPAFVPHSQRANTHLKNLLAQYAQASTETESASKSEIAAALSELPSKYELVGDVLMIPQLALRCALWQRVMDSMEERRFWKELAACFGLNRVARKALVHSGPMRQSQVQLLYHEQEGESEAPDGDKKRKKKRCVCGEDHSQTPGWVTVCENRIKFSFDITKVMFCSGNNTERMRMGALRLPGEVVVDLYCGIGYYTVPLLARSGLRFLYALEWNPNSIFALRHNLAANKVDASRYEIRFGDNRETSRSLVDVADRVLLGLLPSSVPGWPLAARALKREGGVLHVHENVHERDIAQWVVDMQRSFEELFLAAGKELRTRVLHVETVKSYAPRVNHYVVDLLCAPPAEIVR